MIKMNLENTCMMNLKHANLQMQNRKEELEQ